MTNGTLIPYEAIADETWSRLITASERRGHPCRLMSVASVTVDGEPDIRLLILRGAERKAATLWFHSEAGAGKVAQFRRNPATGALAYDRPTGVQLRIYGSMRVHIGNDTAKRHWEQIDFAARHEYRMAFAPGHPDSPKDPLHRRQRQQVELRSDWDFDRFAALELRIEEIDWLQVTANDDRRARLRRANNWQVEPVSSPEVSRPADPQTGTEA